MVNGTLRCSGEDHYSSMKPPRAIERCNSLADWSIKNYPYLTKNNMIWKYGVYSETPDYAPIVGSAHPNSRIFYILGCNAWGQASLSYAATLMPALLGYRAMTSEESEYFKVLNIRRFALLPEVLGKSML